jgi:hypothetical protein
VFVGEPQCAIIIIVGLVCVVVKAVSDGEPKIMCRVMAMMKRVY